jgi:hypothetical protein
MKFIQTILVLLLSVTCAKAQVSVFAKVDHIKPDGVDTVGGIALTVSGSTAPYTYTWNPGAINTKDITNKTAGQYTVNVKSASSQTYTNSYKIGYKVQWQNQGYTTFRNDSLTATYVSGTAYSKNTLAASTNGWFEYVINSITSGNHYIGFLDSIATAVIPKDIDYGIYFENSGQDLYAVQTGTNNTLIKSNAKIGDVVRIERNGDVIKYFVNNTAAKTVTVSGVSSKTFKLKAYLSTNTKFTDIGCSFTDLSNQTFAGYVALKPFIRHSSGYGISDGSVKVTPRISFTNTYSWSPGGATTTSVTSLGYGVTKVTVNDSLSNASSHYYNVGYKVQWTNLDLCSVVADSIATSATSNLIATADSKNILREGENGWIEFPIDKLSGETYYIGFSDSLSPLMGNTKDIDYGINFNSTDNYLYYYEGGTSSLLHTSPILGDLVKVERVGNTIYYKLNNVTLQTTTVSGLSSKNLRIKFAMQNTDYLARVGCSFYNTDSTDFKNHVQLTRTVKHSSGTGVTDGFISVSPKLAGAYTYTWLPGSATTSSISSLSGNIYTVTIKDNLANTSTYNSNVGYKVKWTNLNTCFFRNDTIKGTGANNTFNGNAYSKNILSANTNGWIEFVLKAYPANATWLGFTDSTSTSVTTLTEMNYGVVIPAFSRTINYYEGGTTNPLFSYIRIGDVIRIERSGNNILYKVNGTTLRTVSSGTISAKVMKAKVRLQYNNELVNVGCSFVPCTFTMSAGSTQTITCATPSVVLTGTTNLSSPSYTWSPGSITTSTAGVTTPGTYTLAVSSSSGQCVAQSTVAVVEPFSTSASISNYQNDSVPGEVELCAKGGVLPYNIVWNGQRVPSYDMVYSMIVASGITLPIDTVRLKHDLDSIRTVTKYKQLEPGIYQATVYTANDSLKTLNVVGGKITWALSKGTNFTSAQVPEFQTGGNRYLYGSGENLTQSGAYYLGESVAYTANVISRDYNNYIRFSVPNLSDTVHVGLTFRKPQLDSIPDDSVMIARMLFEGSNVKVKFAGSFLYTGSRGSSDVFTMSNDTATGKLSFYQNSTLLAQVNFINAFRGSGTVSEDVLLVSVGLKKAGATLNNLVIVSNAKYLQNRVEGTITDATCGNSCSGKIDASGISVDNVVPVKYEIIDIATNTVFNTITYTAGTNHALFTGLCAGKYKIKYYAEKSQYTFGGTPVTSTVIYQKTFEVAYMPDWVNNAGVTISSTDRSLTKSAGAIYNWDAGASSLNTLLAGQSGWIEWSPSLETQINGIGFSTSDVSLDIATINYGIGYIRIDLGLWGTWRYYVKTNNNTMIGSITAPNTNVLQPYNQNDKFRLEKNGSNILLSLNGTLINQFAGVSTTTPFILDASLKFFGGTILHPRVSFGCPATPQQYAVLKTSMDGHYYELSGNNLRFTLDGEYTLGYLKYKVLNNQQVVVASDYYNTSLLSPANIKPGDNRYNLNCNSLPAGYYTLEVTNEKNEKQYLRFKR